MNRNSFALITLVVFSIQSHADIAIKPGRWLVTARTWVNGVDVEAQSKQWHEDARARMTADERAELDRTAREQGDSSKEYECVKPEDVAIPPKEFMAKMMRDTDDNPQSCEFSDQHVDSTRISYNFVCRAKGQNIRSKGRTQIHFRETSYHMESSGTVTDPTEGGKPGAASLNSHATADGKWVSANCQPEDPRVSLGKNASEE